MKWNLTSGAPDQGPGDHGVGDEPTTALPPENLTWLYGSNRSLEERYLGEQDGGGGGGPGAERIIVPLIFAVVVLLGCMGNALVVIVVLKNKDHRRNTTNLFILNLAIADVLFLVFCVPFHAIIYTTEWPFGEFMCKFVHLVQYCSMLASVYTLVAMAADRFLAVSHPLMTKHVRTPSKALLTSLVIWALSLGMAAPWPFFYTVFQYPDNSSESVAVCADDWGDAIHHRRTYFLILFLLGYAIPLSLIFILSALMIRQLWALSAAEGPCRRGSIRAKRKVTKLVVVVVLVFGLCWLPSHVIWLWTNYHPLTFSRTYTSYYLRIAAHVLSYANSSINPVIYAFLSTQFRKGFNRALHMQCAEIPTMQSSVRHTSRYSVTAHGNGAHADRQTAALVETTF